ncbi:hypothetical protein N7U49_24625 [Streptomyces sp. AD2-2]|nr:hypothetical protein N7U49_24625 [Streptomyces sp. AD2-2]
MTPWLRTWPSLRATGLLLVLGTGAVVNPAGGGLPAYGVEAGSGAGTGGAGGGRVAGTGGAGGGRVAVTASAAGAASASASPPP